MIAAIKSHDKYVEKIEQENKKKSEYEIESLGFYAPYLTSSCFHRLKSKKIKHTYFPDESNYMY